MIFDYSDIMKEYNVWFSANGERLAYVTFNDTGVPEVRLPIYSEPDSFQLYTEQVLLRYPTVSHHYHSYKRSEGITWNSNKIAKQSVILSLAIFIPLVRKIL